MINREIVNDSTGIKFQPTSERTTIQSFIEAFLSKLGAFAAGIVILMIILWFIFR